MDATLVPLEELDSRDLGSWRELADRAVEPNPFFDPDFVLPAARGLGEWDEVAIMRMRDGSDWIACLPVRHYSRWHGLPLPSVGTWMHSYCFLGTPLVDRDHLDRFAASFAEGARKRHHRRFLALGSIAEGTVFKAIRSSIAESEQLRVAYQEEFQRALLKRRPEHDYLSGLSARHRREMGRLRRRLEGELGGELTVGDRAGDPETLDRFLQIEASGWKGREGTAMGCIDSVGEFFREMCAGFAARGRLQLLSMEAGGRVAAMKCNLGAGDTLFSFKIAYEDELSRYSPGVLLEVENVDVFHEQRSEALFDSCAEPGNAMINRLWPDRRSIGTIVLGPSGPSSLAFGLAGNAIRRGRERRMQHV